MSDAYTQLNSVLKGRVKRNMPLKDYLDFGVGGPAEFFLHTASEIEQKKAVQIANMLAVTYYQLSHDDNVLIPDGGIKGLVLFHGSVQTDGEKKSGTIFKNIAITDDVLKDLSEHDADIPVDAKIDSVISPGELIGALELPANNVGDIYLDEADRNRFINRGSGTADNVMIFISMIKQQVRDKLGIQLQEEIDVINS